MDLERGFRTAEIIGKGSELGAVVPAKAMGACGFEQEAFRPVAVARVHQDVDIIGGEAG